MTALTIELKLSSVRMMSEASLATSVPAIPIANPTSAFLRAGPSLVPSPVTATTSRLGLSLDSMMCLTRTYLSEGEDRAKTRRRGHTLSKRCWLTSPFVSRILRLNSFPSRTRKSSPGLIIPHFIAIDLAVFTLSPVTILTVMPAFWHLLIAAGTSSLTGSSIPTIQRQVSRETMESSSSQLGSASIWISWGEVGFLLT